MIGMVIRVVSMATTGAWWNSVTVARYPAPAIVAMILAGLLLVAYFVDLNVQIGKRFAKSCWFALGMIVLAPIFYPILAFGTSVYTPLSTTAPTPIPTPTV